MEATKSSKEVECRVLFQINGEDKSYYLNRLKEFCSFFDSEKIKAVEFGKQDLRGTESISFIDQRSCIPQQVFFRNKWELLGFVQGFNSGIAFDKHYMPFKDLLKKRC